MDLQWARIDGEKINPTISSTGLSFDVNKKEFVWECEVIINPKKNTALEGLYISNGMYCTQCEAEGFRKITYYPDRPDVMAEFLFVSKEIKILFSQTVIQPLKEKAGLNGMTHGPSHHIYLHLLQEI